jgi:hypothetical protein
VGLRRATAVGTVLLAVLAGCGGHSGSGTPPTVTVHAADQAVRLKPTQYCLDGDGRRYRVQPPIIEVSPDSPITFTVPDAVAAQGWSVQVFDNQLEQKIGEVAVDKGKAVFDGLSSSDVAPAGFYLVVVEDKGEACDGFSGAWPVGFIRDDGGATGSATATATPAG